MEYEKRGVKDDSIWLIPATRKIELPKIEVKEVTYGVGLGIQFFTYYIHMEMIHRHLKFWTEG